VNAGLRFERGKWAVNAQVKNLTDARYFRSNFPDLFGSSVVLPELPRHYLLSGTFKF
jgi:iron complex outermembrane receptor protein